MIIIITNILITNLQSNLLYLLLILKIYLIHILCMSLNRLFNRLSILNYRFFF